MPTTANFSLEYPDDNSSVDIAGHFETLADDVDEAINTRLALTGGTLTGALAGTLTTDASSSTTGAFKTAGGMGIAKALYVGTTLNVTGATTLTGDLTVSKASASLTMTATTGNAIASISSTAGESVLYMDRPASSWGGAYWRTGTSKRWSLLANPTAEGGSNAGSNLVLYRYSDAGSIIDAPLTINRSTGAFTLTGDMLISKATALHTVNATSGDAAINISSAAGSYVSLRLHTSGTNRWTFNKSNEAESGSDAGSNFLLYRYTDAGSGTVALSITRSTGAVTLTGDLTISKASATATLTGTNPLLLLSGTGFSGPIIRLTANSGQPKIIDFQTGGVMRFRLYTDSVAESGSSVGSDFSIARKVDGGSETNALTISRATGKTTLGSVGASAGLELGSSGPRMMSGTGSPEGVVTAPVGSQWIDTAATTGAVAWRKASGTGSSGWVVEYGDTGLRQCTVSETAVFTHAPYTAADPGAVLFLRRVGNVVTATFKRGAAPTWATNYTGIITLPLGWKTRSFGGDYMGTYFPLMDGSAVGTTKTLYFTSTNVLSAAGTWVTGTQYWGSAQWVTEDAWPSSLPGSAV